jgi:hypothetical protein
MRAKPPELAGFREAWVANPLIMTSADALVQPAETAA